MSRKIYEPPSLFASSLCCCVNNNINIRILDHIYETLNHKEDLEVIIKDCNQLYCTNILCDHIRVITINSDNKTLWKNYYKYLNNYILNITPIRKVYIDTTGWLSRKRTKFNEQRNSIKRRLFE